MATKIIDRSTWWVVSGGANPDADCDYRHYWMIYYDQSESNAQNNRTKIIVDYYLQLNKSQSTEGWDSQGYPSGTATCYINGSSIGSVSSASGTVMVGTEWALTYLGRRETYISHNQDGTGSFTFQGSGFGKWTSVSTYTVPTIQRSAVLGNVSSFIADDGVTIPMTEYVSSYYNRIKIYQNVSGSYQLIKQVDDVYNGSVITFTDTELNTIYTNTLINSSTFKFELLTYSDSEYSNQIGSTSSKTTTCRLTIVLPSFGGFDYKDTNNITTSLTPSNQTVVNGKSSLLIQVPSSKRATANTRQTNISYYVVDDKTVEVSVIEGNGYPIDNYAKDNISVYAVDSRGSSSLVSNYSFSQNNLFIDYSNVEKDSSQSYSRNNNGIGELVSLSFSGTWWNGSFSDTTNNALQMSYKYKKSGEQSYSDSKSITSFTTNQNRFSFDGEIEGDPNYNYGFDISESYDIIVTVSDELSSVDYIFNIHSGEPAIAIYKNKVSLGAAYDEYLGGLQLWGDTYLNGTLLEPPITTDILYTGELYGGNSVNIDMTSYSKLRIYACSYSSNFVFDMDLTHTIPNIRTTDRPYLSGGVTSFYEDNDSNFEYHMCQVEVNTNKTVLYNAYMGYVRAGITYIRTGNENYYIYKVEGIK